jgi:hypothetical protein
VSFSVIINSYIVHISAFLIAIENFYLLKKQIKENFVKTKIVDSKIQES